MQHFSFSGLHFIIFISVATEDYEVMFCFVESFVMWVGIGYLWLVGNFLPRLSHAGCHEIKGFDLLCGLILWIFRLWYQHVDIFVREIFTFALSSLTSWIFRLGYLFIRRFLREIDIFACCLEWRNRHWNVLYVHAFFLRRVFPIKWSYNNIFLF